MADNSSSSDDGSRGARSIPRREGNPWERQRSFNRQRSAVLRQREQPAKAEEARAVDASQEERAQTPQDTQGAYYHRITDFHQRQSREREKTRTHEHLAVSQHGQPDDGDDQSE